MIGKASEIKISDTLGGTGSVREWLKEHPNMMVLDIKVTGTDDMDYFFIIYKEAKENE